MDPFWCEQGTVSHTTVIEVLLTVVLVSPTGAPAGAAKLCVQN